MHLRLVAHAQRAAGQLGTRTGRAKSGVVAFFDQLALVHLGRRGHPQLGRNVALAAQQLGCGAEVTNVGHARTDKGFVDLGAGHFGQELGVVRIVRAANDGLFDVGQVDLDHGGVLGIFVGFQQLGVVQPGLHFLDAALQGFRVLVAVGNHVLHQHDVGLQVLDDRLFVQLDRATSGRALGRSVGQLKRLLHFQLGQTFDFQNAARENVLLARLGHREQTGLDGVQRDGMHQIAQGHARLQLALEAHQHRFGHVQRHHTGGSTKGHQARACREGNTNRETRVRVTARAHGIGQQQAVEPAVDHAVARAQRHATTAADEVRQGAVGFHVHRLGIGGGVAERLHHHVGREAQASQVFQLVARHRAGGVLRAHGGHLGFAVSAGAHALAFRQTAGAAHHFLRQGKASLGFGRCLRQAENGGSGQPQGFAGFGGQGAANDQVDTAAGLHFVQQHLALELEVGNLGAVFFDLAFVGEDVDDIAHFHLGNVHFDGQRARIFLGVEEDGGNLAAQRYTAKALVGHKGDVFAGGPDHAVGGRFTAGAGAHHVAHVGHGVAFFLQVFDELDGAAHAILLRLEGGIGARVFQHRQVVHGDVRARGGIRGGRQVVGVGLAGHLEHGDGDFLGHFGAAGEPLGIGPGLHHFFGLGVAGLGLVGHVVEVVKHQQRLFQRFSRHDGHFGVVQQLDQGVYVVATDHGAQQLGGLGFGDQANLNVTMGHSGQEAGLDLGCIVHAGRHAVGEQVQQKGFFTGGRVLDQLDHIGHLFGIQGQGGDAQLGAFGHVFTVGLQHACSLQR